MCNPNGNWFPHLSRASPRHRVTTSHWVFESFLVSSQLTYRERRSPCSQAPTTCTAGRYNCAISFEGLRRVLGSLNLLWSIPSTARVTMEFAKLVAKNLRLQPALVQLQRVRHDRVEQQIRNQKTLIFLTGLSNRCPNSSQLLNVAADKDLTPQ